MGWGNTSPRFLKMDNNWYKIWPSKMRSLVSSLPTGRMRADMTLLIMTYLDEGGLPDSDNKLAFLTGLPLEDIQALRPYFEFLGHCEGGRLYLDFAEDVIMERVEFAEKKANAANKRWEDSRAKQTEPEESNAQPKKASQSTAKRRNAVHSTAMPNKQTDIHTGTDNSYELSGADALTEPSGKTKKPPDPLFQEFCLQFQTAHDGEPYAYKPADFVKLAGLRDRYAKAKPEPWEVTVSRFRQAAENYFHSDLATHTLADLCERFSTFFRNPVDRFNKPMAVNGAPNGNGAAEPQRPPLVVAPPEYRQSRQRENVSE